jgi:hypothetical protein
MGHVLKCASRLLQALDEFLEGILEGCVHDLLLRIEFKIEYGHVPEGIPYEIMLLDLIDGCDPDGVEFLGIYFQCCLNLLFDPIAFEAVFGKDSFILS